MADDGSRRMSAHGGGRRRDNVVFVFDGPEVIPCRLSYRPTALLDKPAVAPDETSLICTRFHFCRLFRLCSQPRIPFIPTFPQNRSRACIRQTKTHPQGRARPKFPHSKAFKTPSHPFSPPDIKEPTHASSCVSFARGRGRAVGRRWATSGTGPISRRTVRPIFELLRAGRQRYGVAAAMYPCPRPTPPWTCPTVVTYAPLAPQQFLYRHTNHYRTCQPDGGMTHTTVHYGHMVKLWPFQPSVMWSVATPHTPLAKAPSTFCMP